MLQYWYCAGMVFPRYVFDVEILVLYQYGFHSGYVFDAGILVLQGLVFSTYLCSGIVPYGFL